MSVNLCCDDNFKLIIFNNRYPGVSRKIKKVAIYVGDSIN